MGERRPFQVAVNLDPAESDLSPLPPAEFVSTATGTGRGDPDRAGRSSIPELTPADIEKKQSIWWFLFVAGAAALLAEAILANRLSKRFGFGLLQSQRPRRFRGWVRVPGRSGVRFGSLGTSAQRIDLGTPPNLDRPDLGPMRSNFSQEITMASLERRDSPAGTGRGHPAGAQPVADASCCCAAGSSSLVGALRGACARVARAPELQVQPGVGHRLPGRDFRHRSPRCLASGSSGRSRRRVSDMQVALYVEEHEPSLQAAILSAVDIGAASEAGTERRCPPVIVDKLVAQAVEKARTIDGGRAVGRHAMQRNAVGARRASPRLGALLLVVGPEFLRQGASALLDARRQREAASPYAIKVTPGDVDGAQGLRPGGHREARRLPVERRRADGEARKASDKFERMPLVATGDAATFEGMLFDVKKPIEYYVEADGVRSPGYTMKVVELPAVDNARARVRLSRPTPACRRRRSRSGGDVAALRGTEVRVQA